MKGCSRRKRGCLGGCWTFGRKRRKKPAAASVFGAEEKRKEKQRQKIDRTHCRRRRRKRSPSFGRKQCGQKRERRQRKQRLSGRSGEDLFAEEKTAEAKGPALRTAEESTQERKTIAPIFTAEIFREKTERREAEERRKTIFMQEAPFAEQEKRKTIPIVAETGLAEKAAAAEEAEELPQEAPKKEREQAKGAEIDIERLMREMTKRLWEEREASGRRLRR